MFRTYSFLTLALCLAVSAANAGEPGTPPPRDAPAGTPQPGMPPRIHTEVVRVGPRDARPVVGVLLGESAGHGVRIVGVTPQGAAAGAGVRSGDLLLSVDGAAISGKDGAGRVASARHLLRDLDPQRQVVLGLSRGGAPLSVTVTPRVAATVSVVDNLAILPDDIRQIVLRSTRDIDPKVVLPDDIGRRVEVIRRGAGPCEGDACRRSLWSEALRWNNLSLIALEPRLGRYFGTDRGVLVLAQGALPGLEAGDVIQKIEGTPVASPRDAMQAMNARQPGQQARFTVLRDRVVREVDVAVPAAMPARLEFVPAPPVPPAAPVPAPRPPSPPPAPATAALQR
ncbi:PDZ domain-containing protein [Pseudoxanthomonas sp. 10H]|uniref:PDZ domain-containing protein n=1 Tax=Pseudoxanthomonas sp. 10H TaxID=3242729 RepID=UPI003558B10A